jgi:hypothetical protein
MPCNLHSASNCRSLSKCSGNDHCEQQLYVTHPAKATHDLRSPHSEGRQKRHCLVPASGCYEWAKRPRLLDGIFGFGGNPRLRSSTSCVAADAPQRYAPALSCSARGGGTLRIPSGAAAGSRTLRQNPSHPHTIMRAAFRKLLLPFGRVFPPRLASQRQR